jgi:hypothetical protein
LDTYKRMKERGTESLELHMGKCMNCFKGCDVHVFKEVRYTSEIPLYIDMKDGELKDIRVCYNNKPLSLVEK